jgi:hypothetical protein
METDKSAAQPLLPVQEPRWYCIGTTGMATLCADEDDAKQNAKLAEQDWPLHAPYRAVQLCEYTPPLPVQERLWIWLSDADIRETIDSICQYNGDYDEWLCKKIERKIKELNT